MSTATHLEYRENHWIGRFSAMASPCEILAETEDRKLAAKLLDIVSTEALRIEQKFSRYRDDNILHKINSSNGKPVEVDTETAHLLEFSQTLYTLSDKLFDITSGVLREAWKFDGSDRIPDPESVLKILPRIGWDKVSWQNPILQMQDGMQIDFGGIGKEYAVDRTMLKIRSITDTPCLINFGGDLAITKPRAGNNAWQIGIESTLNPGQISEHLIRLYQGALATSGDVRRYLIKDGVRYSHILNPQTGWPIANAPHSVTVAAQTCTEAGMLSTLGMLKGIDCESFLEDEGVKYWCTRSAEDASN